MGESYWADQKVCLGLSARWYKNLNKLFGPPNISGESQITSKLVTREVLPCPSCFPAGSRLAPRVTCSFSGIVLPERSLESKL